MQTAQPTTEDYEDEPIHPGLLAMYRLLEDIAKLMDEKKGIEQANEAA